jgi:L-ascorbate metabolism protein UlaG (beta-lactamase superfamily)
MTRRVIDPEQLTFVDVVTSSHNHSDHLDRDTLLPLLSTDKPATLVIPEANRTFVAERLGIPAALPLGLDDGVTISVEDVSITGVPAAHEEVERDHAGRHRFLGYVIRLGSWTLYHSGDTVWFEGLTERLRPFAVDVALLPINGSAPERRVAGNLNGREAARLAKEIGARVVIPCHYEMFAFNTASPVSFQEEAQRVRQPYRLLRCGERWSSRELSVRDCI